MLTKMLVSVFRDDLADLKWQMGKKLFSTQISIWRSITIRNEKDNKETGNPKRGTPLTFSNAPPRQCYIS